MKLLNENKKEIQIGILTSIVGGIFIILFNNMYEYFWGITAKTFFYYNVILVLLILIYTFFVIIFFRKFISDSVIKTLSKKFDDTNNEIKNESKLITETITNKINETDKEIHLISEEFKYLLSNLAYVTWSTNLEEHDLNIYRKMVSTVKDSKISGIDVLSFFRQEDLPIEKGKDVIKNYYKSIEERLAKGRFRYRRCVILRSKLTENRLIKNPFELLKDRNEFQKHLQDIKSQNFDNVEIKGFIDEGRIIDVGYALVYEGNILERRISTLVIEISVWNIEKEKPIMGFLFIDKPNGDLIETFKGAFDGLFNGKLNIKSFNLLD